MNGSEDTLPVTVLHTEQMLETSLQKEENHARPPNPSGKQAPILSDTALLFANFHPNIN